MTQEEKLLLIKDLCAMVPYSVIVHRYSDNCYSDNCDINHKDENPHNNSVNNIEWCNESYNMSYGTIQERRREAFKRKRLLRTDA